ncbi:MAG: HypC/HybG/HupF family hydrogenase formation chaperone [Magnetospirillum sp.]|nr:HypC/HybG/HupF family hydrogenase formation chaperone [Magnetospirillum sp.]
MCLAFPARVVEIGEGETAVVEMGGVRKSIMLTMVDDVAVGDYVIVHVGYALSRLDAQEAERTLQAFADLEQALAQDAP